MVEFAFFFTYAWSSQVSKSIANVKDFMVGYLPFRYKICLLVCPIIMLELFWDLCVFPSSFILAATTLNLPVCVSTTKCPWIIFSLSWYTIHEVQVQWTIAKIVNALQKIARAFVLIEDAYASCQIGQPQLDLLNTQYLFSKREDIYKALSFDWYVDRIFQNFSVMLL